MEKINMNVLHQLFTNEAKQPVSTRAKKLYIVEIYDEYTKRIELFRNKDLDGFVRKLTPQELSNNDLLLLYGELHQSNLIDLRLLDGTLHFYPLWLKYVEVDHTPSWIRPIGFYQDELMNVNNGFKERNCMKHRMTIDKMNLLIEEFIADQLVLNKMYYDISDVLRHCQNWINKRVSNSPGSSGSNGTIHHKL